MELATLMLQPSGAKAGTPAAEAPAQPAPASQGTPPAAGGQPPPPQMGIFGSPLFFILLFLPFIFIMWRRNKRETDARAKLKKGDKVVAGGGLVGEVVDLDERIAKVKIAPGVTVQVLASALGPFETGAPAAAAPKDSKDSKDSKEKDKTTPKNALESK